MLVKQDAKKQPINFMAIFITIWYAKFEPYRNSVQIKEGKKEQDH